MLNLRFSLALTICESWALFFVSLLCVGLIGVFLHDGTLQCLEGFPAGWAFLVLQQRQGLGRGFGASGVHLDPQWLVLLSVLGQWFCSCLPVVCCGSHCEGLWLFYVLLYVILCPF